MVLIHGGGHGRRPREKGNALVRSSRTRETQSDRPRAVRRGELRRTSRFPIHPGERNQTQPR